MGYTSVYQSKADVSDVLFSRNRFQMSKQYMLMPVWSFRGQQWLTRPAQHGWTILPFALSAVFFILWILAIPSSLPIEALSLLIAISLLLVQSALMQNDDFN